MPRGPLAGRYLRIYPGGIPPLWWDPNDVGLSCVAAYRAIATPGSPWGAGPANYAASLVNLVTPGINDLVEGNGALPWAPPTGWSLVAALAQWLDTGLVPANDQSWSMFIQYANGIQGYLGMVSNGGVRHFGIRLDPVLGTVAYFNGGGINGVAFPPAANFAVSGDSGFINGVLDLAGLPGWAGPSIFNLYLGCRNNAGVAQQFCTAEIWGVAIYDAGPAAVQAEALAIITAMAAL